MALAAIVVIIAAVTLYVGGVFGSSGKSHPAVASTPTTAVTTATVPAPSTSSNAPPPVNPGPTTTLHTYLHELGSGSERAAFNLMSASYRHKNPSWVSEREEADPQIKLISIGTANYFAGAAAVPVEFYARDKFPSRGSDTQCRLFNGAITMIHVGSQWQYEPAASHLTATVLPPGNANCPG